MATAKHQKGHDLDDVPASNRKDKVRPSDLVDIYNIPQKWGRIRPFGAWFLYGGHWVKTKTREGKLTSFYTVCLSFDQESGKRDASKPCPWCSHTNEEEIRFSVDYWSNAIVRALQKSRPETLPRPTKEELATGVKDKNSESWTPVRAVRLPQGPIRDIKDMKELNVHENAEEESIAYPVSHAKYGCDVLIKLDPNAPPAKRYSTNKGDPKPITKEEKGYLTYDLSELQVADSLEEAEKEYKSWLKRMHPEKAGGGDDDDDEPAPKKGKRKVLDDDDDDEPAPKKKARAVPVDDDDDDDEPAPKKKGKPPVDDDDDDDEPPPKKKGKPPVDDDDDEDDEPAPKKRGKPPADEDDDDDDDEPPAKKKKPASRPPADEDDDEDVPPPKKKKKAVVDDDDDEDEEPPKKVAAKKAKRPPVEDDEDDEPPPKKKKKPVVDDDDEDL